MTDLPTELLGGGFRDRGADTTPLIDRPTDKARVPAGSATTSPTTPVLTDGHYVFLLRLTDGQTDVFITCVAFSYCVFLYIYLFIMFVCAFYIELAIEYSFNKGSIKPC